MTTDRDREPAKAPGSAIDEGRRRWEAETLRPHLEKFGLDPARVVFEDRSRNTHENAVLTRELVRPAAGETWILITSAFHMPRAVGAFRKGARISSLSVSAKCSTASR